MADYVESMIVWNDNNDEVILDATELMSEFDQEGKTLHLLMVVKNWHMILTAITMT